MTITMTEKNQVTIPKKITNILGLKRGTMFNVEVSRSRIELIPVDVKEMSFSAEQYKKLEKLSREEKGREKKATSVFIRQLQKGRTSA
jgi:AbrB family looped-hinge helix DNA binding protein